MAPDWQQQADAVGADDAQHIGFGGVEHFLGQFAPDSGRDHAGCPRSLAAQLLDDARNGLRGRCDQGEIGRLGQPLDARRAGPALDFRAPGVDEVNRPLEAALDQVSRHGVADGAMGGARADEGHRAGLEHLVQVAYGHDFPADGLWAGLEKSGEQAFLALLPPPQEGGTNINGLALPKDERISGWARAARRGSHRSRAGFCGRATRLPRISPAGDTDGISCPPALHRAPA
jgi:hypothetical protein